MPMSLSKVLAQNVVLITAKCEQKFITMLERFHITHSCVDGTTELLQLR